jgi:hypothetical protein
MRRYHCRCQAHRLGRSTKKYLRRNSSSRPRSGAPQHTHITSRSMANPEGASTRTILYFAAQLGQSNGTDEESDMGRHLENSLPSEKC